MANKDYPNGFKAIAPAGTTVPMYPYYTKSNLTLNPGDAVILLSTGVVDIALAASTTILGVCQSKVAAEAGVQKQVNVIPALPSIVFSGQCSGTYSPVNAGESVDIEGATGVMEVDENAQSTGVVRIVGLEGGIDNAVGANARVLFTWAKSQWTA
jgi:hypothetical protein